MNQVLTEKQLRNRKINKITLTVLGIILLLFVIIAIAAGSGDSKKQAATTTPAPAAVTPVPLTTKQQVSAWYGKYGNHLSAIITDFTALQNDGTNADVASTRNDCVQLGRDAKTAQADPAIPDGTTEQHWSSALSYYVSGSQDCIAGIDNSDSNQISQSTAEISQGNDELKAATAAIKAL